MIINNQQKNSLVQLLSHDNSQKKIIFNFVKVVLKIVSFSLLEGRVYHVVVIDFEN